MADNVNIDNAASNVLNINGFDGGVGQGTIVFNEDSKDFEYSWDLKIFSKIMKNVEYFEDFSHSENFVFFTIVYVITFLP